MTAICIGPVCVPLEAIIPFFLVFLHKIWNWCRINILGKEAIEAPKGKKKEKKNYYSAEKMDSANNVVTDNDIKELGIMFSLANFFFLYLGICI